jgi:hypothetical protein
MKRGPLAITLSLVVGSLALLVVLVNQLRIVNAPPPDHWPPLLLEPCTWTTVYLDQQLLTDEALPVVAQTLAAAWRRRGWSTQLDVNADGRAALLTGARAGQHVQAVFEQKPGAVHLVAHGEQQCDQAAPGETVSTETTGRGE